MDAKSASKSLPHQTPLLRVSMYIPQLPPILTLFSRTMYETQGHPHCPRAPRSHSNEPVHMDLLKFSDPTPAACLPQAQLLLPASRYKPQCGPCGHFFSFGALSRGKWKVKVKVKLLSHVQLCDTWTVAHQAPLSMGFSRQEHWSGLPFSVLCHCVLSCVNF